MLPFLSYWRAKVCIVSLALTLAACTERVEPADSLGWSETCVDSDLDGYGFQCERGPDCDDQDPEATTVCACKRPLEGCICEAGAAPIDCVLPQDVSADGVLYCHQGKRTCRDGAWSACESITKFEVPASAAPAYEEYLEKRRDRAYLLDPDSCSACRPDCYLVEDPLEPVDGGALSSGTSYVPGGGITLDSRPIDASVDAGTPMPEPEPECMPGKAPDRDCDGIPDEYDPYPSTPPFATDHTTIFMDLAPGATGTKTFEVQFFVNTADIYFLLDMTGSMQDERDKLKDSLTVGNFLDDPSTTMVDESDTVECADRDFDGSADDALKERGIAGNIACLIRDAYLGAGWFREIPFQGPYQSDSDITVGYYDQELFQNEQDLTGDVDDVLAAIGRFQVRGNYNWAEGGIQALHALTTGEELYAGWDRPGVPRRLGCPAGTWGYPCFRDDAVPIVIFITDAPLMNGPAPTAGHLGPWDPSGVGDNNPVDYDLGVLDDLKAGTDGRYHQLGNTHETIATAHDVGTIDRSLLTYTGSTANMAANLTYADIGVCPTGSSAWQASQQGAPDAVFAFHVDEAKELTVSTRGSRFDTALAIFPAGMTPGASVPLSVTGVSGNTGPTNPRDLGTLPDGVSMVVTGNSTGVETNYTRDGLGCMLGTSADYTEDAATFRFRAAEDMTVRITAAGSGFDLATSLYEGSAPGLRQNVNLGAISCLGGGTDNCNDAVGDYNFGDVSGRYVHFTGSTNSAGVDPHFPAAAFQAADPVCAPVTGSSDDQVVDFRLSARTRLRVETMGSGSAEAAGFEHVVALMRRPGGAGSIQHDLRTAGVDNDDEASAYQIAESEVLLGLAEGASVQFLGSAQSLSADYSQADMGGTAAGACNNGNAGAASALRDAVFRLDVTQTESDGSPISFDFDTLPLDPATGYKTWLSVHRERIKSEYALALAPDNYDAESSAVALPDASTSLNQRRVVASSGTVATTPNAATVSTAVMGCGATSAAFPDGGRDAVFRFTLDSATAVNLRTTATNSVTGAPAFNSYIAVFKDSISAANRQTPAACVDQANNGFAISNLALGAGTYYVVVKQWTGSTSGAQQSFGLVIEDANRMPSIVACDAGSHPNSGNYSRLSLPLPPGRYYIVVKGPASGAAPWNYQLNVRKTPPVPTLLACDYESRGNRHGFLERELEPGDYSVVIRGLADNDRGAYALVLRDMGAVPDPVACYNTRSAGSGGATAITAQLQGGVDYFLVSRGNQNNHSGNYTLVIEDVDERPLACARNNAFSIGYDTQLIYNGEVTQRFEPGDYIAVLKGYNTSDSPTNTDDDDKGLYQITFGDRTLQQSGVFAAENWLGPSGNGFGGVRQELLSRGVRVITVASTVGTGHGGNAAAHEQLTTLSQSTGALDVNNAPLAFKINRDGSGMGRAIVDAVNLLAGNLAMDLSVQLKQAPDRPTPNEFEFSARAIDVVGDNCDLPVDRDGDALHIPDTHVQCKPGAVPRFEIKITNPLAKPVAPNPKDPEGGYNMVLELIGDDTYVVDQIPVYVIPQDVVPDEPRQIYEQRGTYEQISGSAGCLSTDAPDWSSLAWNATVPAGTKLTFRVCAGNTTAALQNCSYRLAAQIVSGGTCSSDSQCPDGYCHTDSGICHFVSGASCTADSDCGSGGRCAGSPAVCRWSDNQVDLHPAVRAGWNGKPYMKVQMELQSNSTRTRAPTVEDWKLDYLCSGGQ